MQKPLPKFQGMAEAKQSSINLWHSRPVEQKESDKISFLNNNERQGWWQ